MGATVLKRLPIALLAAAGITAAVAQVDFNTPSTDINARGLVAMSLNGSSQAVPASSSNPLPTVQTGALPAGTATLGNVGTITPAGATARTAASGNVANAAAVATLAAAAGKTTYICGFTLTSSGSTAATVVSPTVVGTITGTLTFTYVSVAGATAANQTVIVPFDPCVPANAVNTAIVVTLPALGAGNTNATVNAWGYQL